MNASAGNTALVAVLIGLFSLSIVTTQFSVDVVEAGAPSAASWIAQPSRIAE